MIVVSRCLDVSRLLSAITFALVLFVAVRLISRISTISLGLRNEENKDGNAVANYMLGFNCEDALSCRGGSSVEVNGISPYFSSEGLRVIRSKRIAF